jgi:lysophospholipase L1-like esterase
MKARLAALTLILLVVFAMPATAAPLSNSAWCQDRASLVVLGASDSTGAFTTGYASPDETYDETPYGWFSRVSGNAGMYWGTASNNYSRNGAQASDFLPGGRWPVTTGAVEQIRQKQPSLVMITLGGNEYLSGVSPATYQANLTQLVRDIHTVSPRTGVLLVALWHIARTNPPHQWWEYTNAMFNVAVSEVTALVDLTQYFPRSDLDTAGLFASDRIHLTDAGNMVVAATMWTWVVSC